MLYWVNFTEPGHIIIHSEACQYAENASNKNTWGGPYASRGATIDIVLARTEKPHEDPYCITSNRVNSGPKYIMIPVRHEEETSHP